MSRKALGAALLVLGLAVPTVWLLGKTNGGDGAAVANVLALPVGALSVVVGVFALTSTHRRPAPTRTPVLPGRAYRIVAKHSGKVLDVEGWSTANFARIIQYDWHGGANQKFEFTELDDGTYRIVSLHSGRCVEVRGEDLNNLAEVGQYEWHGGANQRWRLDPQSDGSYGIQALHSGRHLDVLNFSADAGAPLVQHDWHGGANQRFLIIPG